MKNKTILMGAVLAIATVLAAGLTVLPSTVQEAQANPCATDIEESEAGDASGQTGPGELTRTIANVTSSATLKTHSKRIKNNVNLNLTPFF